MELMNYVDPPDIPAGLTVTEWRRQRATARSRKEPFLVRGLSPFVRIVRPR
jgi:hypothetical protein